MNIDLLRDILVQKRLYVKETSKNIISICPMCGDHPDPSKRGHLYVSKDVSKPICHCFFSHCAFIIPKLITLVTGDKSLADRVISKDELNDVLKKTQQEKIKVTVKEATITVPVLNVDKFPHKVDYINKRTNHMWDVTKIPKLIFDFEEFISINNLSSEIGEYLSNYDIERLQSDFVGFLGRNNSMLYCRSIDDDSKYKFRKVQIQKRYPDLLDYVSVPGNNKNSKTIVFSEGTFNILVESAYDSLQIKNDVRLYVACQSWSYIAALKSVLFDEMLFNCDVIILSDRDKFIKHYHEFYEQSKHVINSFSIFYNRTGKDFGCYPPSPFENIYVEKQKKWNRKWRNI